jgi:hypothetical protein
VDDPGLCHPDFQMRLYPTDGQDQCAYGCVQ